MEGYLETRMSSVVKYSVGESKMGDDCNWLNVFVNGVVVTVPVDTEGFTDATVKKLYTAVENAFSGDSLDMFFDNEVIT